jgi:UDP-glucose:(heptosyl)LPS alpha-1,3-glucosyltransferase
MNIALVIPNFDPHVGGAERWTWDFAARLLRHGHVVHVVAQSFAVATDAELGGVVRHVVPRVRGTFRQQRFGFAAGAEEILRRLDVDVIHDMGHGWFCNVFMPHGGTRGGSMRQNVALWPAGLRWVKEASAKFLPRYRTFRELEQRQYVADGSRVFVALSEMVRRDMSRFHALPAHVVRVVYNGIDTERFSPVRGTRYRERTRRELGVRNEVVFLLVAHNFKLKGVGPAIRAISDLAYERRDVRLVVVGGDRPGRYERLAARLDCPDLVQFIGRVNDSVPYYGAADVYLHPTHYDPCSLVVLEALASGLPVITTRNNGAGELITPGREGFVLDDPADIRAMTGAMRPLLDEPFRVAASRRARELTEQHDLERNYREILTVYEDAIRHAPLVARRRSA